MQKINQSIVTIIQQSDIAHIMKKMGCNLLHSYTDKFPNSVEFFTTDCTSCRRSFTLIKNKSQSYCFAINGASIVDFLPNQEKINLPFDLKILLEDKDSSFKAPSIFEKRKMQSICPRLKTLL